MLSRILIPPDGSALAESILSPVIDPAGRCGSEPVPSRPSRISDLLLSGEGTAAPPFREAPLPAAHRLPLGPDRPAPPIRHIGIYAGT